MLNLSEFKQREREQLLIMDYYTKGLTCKEIAKKLGLKENTVRTRVNRVMSKMSNKAKLNLREIHNLNRLERKECDKALNYEINKEMGKKSFILKNRSAYNSRVNGNIVLKSEEELGCNVTWDTPKNLINDAREEKNEEFRPVISSEIGKIIASHYSKELSNTRILSDGERKIIYNSNYLN
ncbi:LuxR C-terminal-related transcriptional regulator [Clostridium perfringens]|uniref:helix-turn-helix transcriptional regulator n=1 Tax=Clostridium perfringens TaxID=1502 RepID=UPI00224646AA|nr:LuxR C-terminal-related transcriptional regulator [Clostridium perfringens]MCX0355835.1 LuxR C-terminal-related transcriptional regulator [Clostridium perfringens]